MELGTLKYKVAPYGKALLGSGAYGIVYRATEGGSGRPAALKISRVSKTVLRPILRYEARILQHLRSHPAIPAVYGYVQWEHFEYLAMELLGPSVAEKQKDGAAVMVKTVIQLLDQSLGALQHIHSLGIVHRDIKPENILCTLDDPARVKLIDFGISKPFSSHRQSKHDPLKDRRHIMGSLYWASLNSHNGEDLAPRDDLESLALVALFLLRGNLPWKPRPHKESRLRSQEVTRILKSGPALFAGFPNVFGELLTYSRSLTYDQLPDYDALRASFADLANELGYSNKGPLDWTPCCPHPTTLALEEPEVSIPDEDEDEDECGDSDDDLGEDSYFNWDIDVWDRQGERDKDLTLPAEQEAELDEITPVIGDVIES
ncbi:putative casein kinase-1 hhp1 [Boletus reticuloceps]|uniref:non-specific serine/threonine protein kinase n=1 Tax=Boletus reticuloceps TaxID=495285 RepID=A0A8I3ACP4_9AGAM|nr:putative casein kinase-1 hhp1 [Boletus reticuloceps]